VTITLPNGKRSTFYFRPQSGGGYSAFDDAALFAEPESTDRW